MATEKHHIVTVWGLDDAPPYELFFRFAQGFAHAALAILEKQNSSDSRDFFSIVPAHFTLEHSIELFLKGAILLGDDSITLETLSSKQFGHNLLKLYERYREVFSSDQFRIYSRIDELIDWRARINDPRGFAARYPFDRNGARYGPQNLQVDVEFELEVFRGFLKDLVRLEREIKETMGVPSYRIEQFRYRSSR